MAERFLQILFCFIQRNFINYQLSTSRAQGRRLEV